MYEHPPPGRAGVRWLQARITAAERGVELLEDKRQLLLAEQKRLRHVEDLAHRRWTTAAAEADRWTRRLAASAGTDGLALAARDVAGRATLAVAWQNTMGVLHPQAATCSTPGLPAGEAAAGSASLPPLAGACRAALEAAADEAVAVRALALVEAELHASGRRLRALRDHRLPLLRDHLQLLGQQLDEIERAERLTTRWCRERTKGA